MLRSLLHSSPASGEQDLRHAYGWIARARVVITMSTGLQSPQQLRAAGGARCVAKSASGPIIARTIGAAGRGRQGVPNAAAVTADECHLATLPPSAAGATNCEIAREMFLSHDTIKAGTRALYRKPGVRNRTEAVLEAQRRGLLMADGPATLQPIARSFGICVRQPGQAVERETAFASDGRRANPRAAR